MKRREFIAGIAGAAAWPVVARAQQTSLPVVGFLNSVSPAGYETYIKAFLRGLGSERFVAGRNVTIEYRWADQHIERLPSLVADLISRKVAVIAAGGSPSAAVAAKAATSTIPIVFTVAADPISLGLVASYNRPGGNATGAAAMIGELAGKRLSLLRELVPQARTFAYLRSVTELVEVSVTARGLGLELHEVAVTSESQFEDAFEAIKQMSADALYVSASTLFLNRRERVAELVAQASIPAIYGYRDFVLAGGLVSYGSSPLDFYRQMGVYVGRILKGVAPADLPVVQPTKFEFAINLKTAKALGLTVPETLLATADEVIE